MVIVLAKLSIKILCYISSAYVFHFGLLFLDFSFRNQSPQIIGTKYLCFHFSFLHYFNCYEKCLSNKNIKVSNFCLVQFRSNRSLLFEPRLQLSSLFWNVLLSSKDFKKSSESEI